MRAVTSADTALATKLDPKLRALGTRSAANVEVMVYVPRGAAAPAQLSNAIRVRLGADKTSDIWVGRVGVKQLTKLATGGGVRYVADNRPVDPPKLPDVPGIDPAKRRAAAKKAAARIAAATKAGVVKRWASSFDAKGRLSAAATSSDGSQPGRPSQASGGTAPTGWMDVGTTHKSSAAWAKGYTGSGVLVGVADSGVDFAHPDLQGTQATVTASASPYRGWPLAYDPYSLMQYASDAQRGTTNVASGRTWFADTSHVVARNGSGMATYDTVSYVLPNVSKSGNYHIGYHPDEFLAQGYTRGKAAVLVTDEGTAGVYDTVRVDLNANDDFTDDKACTKASPISWLDYWDSAGNHPGSDGYADVSGGMIYWIADGTHQPPGYDLHFSGGTKPSTGNMVCFMGSLDDDGTDGHGTLCASNIVGQGVIDGSSDNDEYPSFKGAGTGGIVQGAGKNARLVAVGNIYQSETAPLMAYDFAARGLDTVANTGDELQTLSCSFGNSTTDNDGWDYRSRYIENLNTTIATSTAFVFSTGNGGPGYGTVTAPSGSTEIMVGASTQFGACGGWDSILATDQVTTGDVIPWSNRGPSSMGRTGVSVVADGAYSSGALPLNMTYYADGWRAWEIWGGTSRSTPVTAGNLTLVQQAFKARFGRWPTWSEARTLMMSGATDLSYDSLVQGAGMVDAEHSVDLAAGLGGIKASPSSWAAGDFRGTKRDAFSNIMHPGDADSTTITVTNEGSSQTTLSASAVWHQRVSTQTMDIVLDPAQESAYDFNRPDKLVDITSLVPTNTDLVVIRTAYPLSEMDPTGSIDTSAGTKNDIRVLGYDWKDTNSDANLWTDGNANGFVNAGEIDSGEYERFTYGFGRGTSHEIRIQRPKQRMHTGVFLGFQHRNRPVGGGQVHVKVEISCWNRVSWPWMSLSDSSLTLPAHSSSSIGATLSVPADAALGIYDGQILLTQGTRKTVVPVSVNVAGESANMEFGGTNPYQTLMDNRKVFGYQDWNWRAESGDWRYYSADVPDSPALPTGARWLVHTSWDATPTDNDTLLYGPQARTASWPSGPDSIFGAYDLALKGGSASRYLGQGRWAFGTATGEANEWVSGPLSSGLNEILIHNTMYSGASIGSTFTGSAGRIASLPGTITVRSNADSGTVAVPFSTSIDLPGLSTSVSGLSQVQRFTPTISQAQTWSMEMTVTSAPYFHATCTCPDADLDMYVYLSLIHISEPTRPY
jgi:subtilisin family serine protease